MTNGIQSTHEKISATVSPNEPNRLDFLPPAKLKLFTGRSLHLCVSDDFPTPEELQPTEFAAVIHYEYAEMLAELETRPGGPQLLVIQIFPGEDAGQAIQLEMEYEDGEIEDLGRHTVKDPGTKTTEDGSVQFTFLFLFGDPLEDIESKAFKGIHVVDVSDGSGPGYPDSIKVEVEGHGTFPIPLVEMSPSIELL